MKHPYSLGRKDLSRSEKNLSELIFSRTYLMESVFDLCWSDCEHWLQCIGYYSGVNYSDHSLDYTSLVVPVFHFPPLIEQDRPPETLEQALILACWDEIAHELT